MGICINKNKSLVDEAQAYSILLAAIESRAVEKVNSLISKHFVASTLCPAFDIDAPVISIEGNTIGFLAYSLVLGASDVFSSLVEIGEASIPLMHKQVLTLGTLPLDIICEAGLVKVLSYYLPLQNNEHDISVSVDKSEEISIFIDESTPRSKPFEPRGAYTSIQRACERGRIGIAQFVYKYYKDGTPPVELDFHHVDESTGDNSAFCAIHSGKLCLLKFLYKKVCVDFQLMNKRKENLLIVAAAWSKKRPKTDYFRVFRFLVETVKLDIAYGYEEILLILEKPFLISYFEGKLSERGIFIQKATIDRQNSVKGRVRSCRERELETKESYSDNNVFLFRETFKAELEDSYISSIAAHSYMDQSISSLQLFNTILK